MRLLILNVTCPKVLINTFNRLQCNLVLSNVRKEDTTYVLQRKKVKKSSSPFLYTLPFIFLVQTFH